MLVCCTNAGHHNGSMVNRLALSSIHTFSTNQAQIAEIKVLPLDSWSNKRMSVPYTLCGC